jgi:hypothetical protein
MVKAPGSGAAGPAGAGDGSSRAHPLRTVAEVVRAEQDRWGLTAVDEEIFGSADPSVIADVLARFCTAHLGGAPLGVHFYRASVGCVVGLRLATGGDVVLKAAQRRWGGAYLRAVQTVQAHLASSGFPCPRPVLAPTPLAANRPNQVTGETLLSDPGMRSDRSADSRRVSATGLAEQIARCREIGSSSGAADHLVAALSTHPMRGPVQGLYPEPHSPLFDFAATARGAEWIDALALQARERRDGDDTAPVIAHTDWSARNVRIGDGRLRAVYDWDSVAVVPESSALGQAAATWCVTSEPGGGEFPTLEEMEAYVDDYEAGAGRELDGAQRGAVRAAAVWVLAYTARCEHSLARRGMARPDQDGARTRLREIGDALLSMT